MVHSISILGSTGSIGRQTVAVAEHLGLNVRALTTNRNIQLAEEQARRLHPAFVAVTDEAAALIGAYGSRLCMLEGFVGHAEQCNIRVRRYGHKNVAYGTAAE